MSQSRAYNVPFILGAFVVLLVVSDRTSDLQKQLAKTSAEMAVMKAELAVIKSELSTANAILIRDRVMECKRSLREE